MCTGHCAHILEVMFFVDVDGTLSDFMRTILVYLFCDSDPLEVICTMIQPSPIQKITKNKYPIG